MSFAPVPDSPVGTASRWRCQLGGGALFAPSFTRRVSSSPSVNIGLFAVSLVGTAAKCISTLGDGLFFHFDEGECDTVVVLVDVFCYSPVFLCFVEVDGVA